jgi:GT2 family glycosyltransferase
MVECMESNRDVGILGCRLLYPDGIVQQGPDRGQPYKEIGAELVDWPFVLGACMLIRGEVLEKCGLMDENLFLFNEDVEYCHRVRRAGWRVCLMPDNCVTHYGGRSYADLDYMAVERQRAVSFITYCTRFLDPWERTRKLANYVINAAWCSAWYSCASLGRKPGYLKKKQMYLARLQALVLYMMKYRRVL